MELITSITTLPTVLWTIPLGICLGFWGLIALGILGLELDGEAETPADGSGLLEAIGVGAVPVSVVGSLVCFGGWSSSLLLHSFFGATLAELLGFIPFIIGVLVLSGAVGLVTSALGARRLAPMFRIHQANAGGASLCGRLVTITSSRVDEQLGTATLQLTASDEILLRVAPAANAGPFHQGDSAILIEYDEQTDTYRVAAPRADTLLPQPQQTT